MSNFLLQKSLKLFQDGNQIKKGKKSSLHRLQKKRNWVAAKKIKEKELEQNTLQNLEAILKLNKIESVDISKEILINHIHPSKDDNNSNIEEEQSTVFTEQDFEEFEKEYMNS